ncbi:hypothetical protein FGRMN_6098 [Fusarium graminum]|nr:hypothetical protein FGRMN_6098 [Fusarium graminum]
MFGGFWRVCGLDNVVGSFPTFQRPSAEGLRDTRALWANEGEGSYELSEALSYAALVAWGFLAAQVSCFDATELLAQLPDCAASCLLDLVSDSTCGLDVKCLCADPKLETQVAGCVQSNCLPREALSTLNVTSIACEYPIRDKHRSFDILGIVLGTITTIIVALRFFAKLHYEHIFRLDDYLVAFSYVLNVSNTALCIYGLSGNGLGTDTWKSSPDTITDFLMYLYIGQTFYASDVFVTKICVLLFYLRIFPVVSVRRVLWGTIALSALCAVLFDILAIAQCQPISFFWKGWDELHEGEGKCIGVNALGWAIAAVSIILDVWVLAIPLSQIVRLQMKWKRKIAVGLMFVVGTFVTVVSILRLRYLVAFGKSTNPLWDSFNTVYWSDIEINVAIWCVCMPDLRMVIRNVFPSLRSSLGSNDVPKGSNPTSRQQGRSTNNSSYHTHENVYKAKPAQRHGDDEPSSSTADLVELSTLTSRHEARSLV